jgi:hypothetical protein
MLVVTHLPNQHHPPVSHQPKPKGTTCKQYEMQIYAVSAVWSYHQHSSLEDE